MRRVRVPDDLRRLAQAYNLDPPRPAWEPLDPDPPAAADVPIPDPAELRAAVPAPAVPVELPAVAQWLDQFARAPLDPWGVPLPPPAPPQDPAG